MLAQLNMVLIKNKTKQNCVWLIECVEFHIMGAFDLAQYSLKMIFLS